VNTAQPLPARQESRARRLRRSPNARFRPENATRTFGATHSARHSRRKTYRRSRLVLDDTPLRDLQHKSSVLAEQVPLPLDSADQSLIHSARCEIVRRDNIQYMSGLEDGRFALVVTSPPYNQKKAYEKTLPLGDYLAQQEQVIREAVRVVKAGGSICWQVGNHVRRSEIVPLDIVLYPIFRQLGLTLRNRIIWHFEHGLHCSNRLSGRYETILWFTKGDDYNFNLDPIRVPSKYPNKKHFKGPKRGQLSGHPLGKNPGDVWLIPNVKANHVEKTEHPCQYPVELVERLILALTNEGDEVLDPYMGTGSTAIAALKRGRHAYGCDISKRYVEIALDRVRRLREGSLRTRPMHRPIYTPDR
jgi:adenine-specific DNA-methyltransferase